MGPLVSPLPHKYIQKQKKLFNALEKYAWQALLDMGSDLYANWLKVDNLPFFWNPSLMVTPSLPSHLIMAFTL